jgi:hypothetical protein
MNASAVALKKKNRAEFMRAYRRAKKGPCLNVKKILRHDGIRIPRRNTSKATGSGKTKIATGQEEIGNYIIRCITHIVVGYIKVKSLFKEVLRVASFNNLSCHTIAVLHLMI